MMTRRRISLAVAMLAVAGSAVFFLSRPREGAAVATVPIPVLIVSSVPPDAPPALRSAEGWPFQQLPMVMKFDLPEPRITIPEFPPFTPRYAEPTPVPQPEPAPGVISPLWLLTPLAAGAAFGGSSDMAVIPEPVTLVLLSTGLLFVGAGARRKKRRG